jgi:hypothetical protein
MAEIGQGAQVTLTGDAQGAARGAVSSTMDGNVAARVAATPVNHQGTPAQAGQVGVFTRVLDIWNRATDDEAALIQGELETTSPKQAGRFASAGWIDHADEMFGTLRERMVALFGAARADVLLAPSPDSGS